MPATDLDTSSWPAFETSLAVHLGQLGDQEFVSISGGPSAPAATEPEPGLFGRLLGRQRAEADDSGAYVQAQRTDEYVYVECVGSRSFGGRHAWTPEQEARLEGLGWVHRPDLVGDKVYIITTDDPALNGHLPVGDGGGVGDLGRAARLMVATLRDVVGVTGPAELDLSVG